MRVGTRPGTPFRGMCMWFSTKLGLKLGDKQVKYAKMHRLARYCDATGGKEKHTPHSLVLALAKNTLFCRLVMGISAIMSSSSCTILPTRHECMRIHVQ